MHPEESDNYAYQVFSLFISFVTLLYLVEHVALATGKASPVGEHHQRQPFVVQVLNGLGGLVRAIGVPDATGLQRYTQAHGHIVLYFRVP